MRMESFLSLLFLLSRNNTLRLVVLLLSLLLLPLYNRLLGLVLSIRI